MMTVGPIPRAIQRQQDCPAIHSKPNRPPKGGGSGGTAGHSQEIFAKVLDLKEHVPELSTRQLATLVGVSRHAVLTALDNSEPMEAWTSDDNPASAAAELAALQATHPGEGYRDEQYRLGVTFIDGNKPDDDELTNVRTLFASPQPSDPHRRADQSHTDRAPITLPQFPFLPLLNRFAGLEHAA